MSGIFGGNADKSAKASEEAARKAEAKYKESTDQAIDFSKQQYQQGRTDLENYYDKGQGYLDPYMGAGKSALNDYLASMGMGDEGAQQGIIDKFTKMPGYQFTLDQGMKAANRGAAARGRTQSGATLKALTRFGQGLASQEFGKYQDRLGNLAGLGAQVAGQASGNAMSTGGNLAGIGQNLASNVGGLYQGQAQNAADAELAAGAARSSAYQNKQNTWSNLIGQGAKGLGYLGGAITGGPIGSAIGGKIGGWLGGG